MISEVWKNDKYYDVAHKGSLDIKHPGMKILFNLSLKANNILDMGCGEGSRLNKLSGKKKIGVDISSTAIKIAKKKYPELNFFVYDLEKLPLKDESFDLVYSAYVLEHLSNPEKVLAEAIRLVSKNGFLVLIAPNYGAPNRCSPPFVGSRVNKFIKGILNDLIIIFNRKKILSWNHVYPIANKQNYCIDWDTTVEPYINTLLSFLKSKNMKIVKYSSCWPEELKNAKFHQTYFRFFGELGIYPFSMWGPHLVIVATKL